MSAAHTPGPWAIEEWLGDFGPTGDYSVYQAGDKNKYPIASIQEPFMREKTKANTFLIAAAPDLLAALQEMLLQFGVRGGNGAFQQAREAIAKATGGAV